MRTGRRRGWLIAAGLAVCLGIAVLVAVAVRSSGYAVRHVALNDGGIWATSDRYGLFGRANLPAGTLDAAFAPPGGAQQDYQLDVSQDGAAVVARDRASGELYPVDVSSGKILADAGIPVAADDQVALGGGSLAVLDPDSGKLWAVRYDAGAGLSSLTGLGGKSPPVAEIGATAATGTGAALAVGTDGTVTALSSAGRLATVAPSGTALERVVYTRLHASLASPQLTSVGPDVVGFDASTGAVLLPGGRTATIPEKDAAAQVQLPGPDAPVVLLATGRSLYAVTLADGAVQSLSDAGTGAPAAPVRVGSCTYAAWTGSPGVAVRSCAGGAAEPIELARQKSLVQPEIRVNHDMAMLNDLVRGGLWNLSTGARLDDWAQVRPPTAPKPAHHRKHPSRQVGRVDAPPHAVADRLGARPGRTTTLHVLDNDSDPAGNILSISGVSGAGAAAQVAPDGQSVQLEMPSSGTAVHFRYTVNDGRGRSASAPVSVVSRPFGVDKAPALRKGFHSRVWPVAAGGKLSLPVLGDWRDFDGDSPVLKSAAARIGSVSTTADGRVDYIAPLHSGHRTLRYAVTDGSRTTRATVHVHVLAVTSTHSSPAVAEPDVARGQVGQPIVVRPLDNDLPGADPTHPDAQLELAAEVANPDGTTVTTDLVAGTVTMTAAHAGTFLFTYSAAFGNAAYAKGSVRVDVTQPPSRTGEPVAVLDTATLHGQHPDIVDVLANDFDPAGRLLVVESADALSATDLQVAIIDGRYLRIAARAPTLRPNPQVVDYVITDGVSASVTGQVSVSQLPDPAHDTPVPQDDFATVRAGDAVSVSVLDNDSDPSGDTLTLAADVRGARPGLLPVSAASGGPAGGSAYVAGGVVRYAAPPAVPTERTVTVDYLVQNSGGDQAVGQLFVTVEPAPSAAHPDKPPAPPEVDARAVAGDTITIPVRSTGVDPDGDAVTLVGIASAPSLGRILGSTPSSLRYQAYPTSAGTDSFSYTVTDRYGRVGHAAMRVAVVSPGDPQPPVATDVEVTAAPGATVSSDVLSYAFSSPDDKVTVLPLARTNAGHVPGHARLRSPAGPIEVTAADGFRPVVVRYAVTDGIGAPSYASLTVRSVPGTDIPPVAADVFAGAVPHHALVTVHPLTKDYDPDGGTVRVSRVFDPRARISGGAITLPVRRQPQIVPYEIADSGGARALAVVFVPARGAGVPTAKPDRLIRVAKNGTKSIDIAGYARDPAGKPLSLTTTSEISASPSSGLRVSAHGRTGLTLTGLNGYVGPASVTFQVTDGRSLTDPKGLFGVITVPVQVGPETPVLRCPATALPVVDGGAALSIDVTSLCHVWVADPAALDHIEYTASWSRNPGNVALSGFGTRTLHVAAGGAALPGSTGTIKVGVSGSEPVPSKIHVVVTRAPPPSVSPVTVDGVVAGRSATVDMADYVSSPIRDKVITIVRADRSSGLAANFRTNGSRITLTPGKQSHGTITFAVTIADVPNSDRVGRQATGRITLHVLGVPGRPTGVAPGRTVRSHVVVLSWNAPDNNGEPIGYYEVAWAGGKHDCPGSPCTISGLTNGEIYRFTVRAHNGVGFGRPSAPSPKAQPNAVPDAPTGVKTSNPGDRTLDVSWRPAKVDGTPVLHYVLSWPGGHTSTPGTSATATGLDNDARTHFTVVAVNKQGAGPAASVVGQSSGTPQYPPPPATPQQPPAPHLGRTEYRDHQAVVVSWPPVDPNGPVPTTYVVTRTVSGGAPHTLCRTTSRQCSDPDVRDDGNQYSYSYVARNGTGNRSQSSRTSSFYARGTPEGVGAFSASGTGQDGHATLHFDEQAVHDKAAVVTCTIVSVAGDPSCGQFRYDGPDAHPGQEHTIRHLADGPVTFRLQQCNTVGTCAAPATASTTVYGQLSPPDIENSHASGPNVDFDVSWNPHGGAVQIEVRVDTQDGTIYDQRFDETDVTDQKDTLHFTDTADASLSTPISAGAAKRVTITATLTDASPLHRNNPDSTHDDSVRTYHAITTELWRGADCAGSTPPTPCGYIHLKLSNFQHDGSVYCTFTASAGTTPAPVTVQTDSNGNVDADLPAEFATPGARLTVTCERVVSTDTVDVLHPQPYTWPSQ